MNVRTLSLGLLFAASSLVASPVAFGQQQDAIEAIDRDISVILDATTDLDTIGPKPTDNALRILAPYGSLPASLAFDRPAAPEAEEAVEKDQESGAVYDAWGARRNFWLAAGETFGVNLLVWTFNEYIRGAGFTQVSPRSWADNISDGFFYDDNHFNNNQFAHPFHGSLYYSAARSNGFNYWASAPFAIAGSFMWECCGETHNMAINDWIATGIGGVAIGESMYRVSGTILDNQATGSERMWREIGGFVTNPLRGFNRLISGRSGKVYENPKEAEDWRALSRSVHLSTGVRVLGQEKTNSPLDSTEVGAYFELNFRFGNPFAKQRRKPFDVFWLNVEGVTGQDEGLLTRFTIRGNLFASDLKRSEKTQHVFSVYQNYDYWNNNAYEFGGQSFSAGIDSRWGLSESLNLGTQLSGDFMLMGAINSDFAFVADLPDVENLRDYDYGIGGGGRLLAYLFSNRGFRYAGVGYRYTFLNTLNGSVVNGSDAYHHIHMAWLQGRVPLGKTFSLGADYFLFLRDSSYSFTLFENTTQRNPQLRVFATWRTGFGGG